jgi:plasmid maintenance system antidote protein VapI
LRWQGRLDAGIPQLGLESDRSAACTLFRKRAITADKDLCLARFFGLSEGFFLGLQADHDLMEQRRKIETVLKTIEPRAA